MRKRILENRVLAIFGCIFISGFAFAEGSRAAPPLWSATASPEVGFPLGEDKQYFGMSVGGEVSAGLRIPSLPLLFAGGSLGYAFISTEAPGISVSSIEAGIQTGLHLQISRSLFARVGGELGYFMANRSGGVEANFNPYFQGGAQLGLEISPIMGFCLGASYRNRYALEGELVASVGAYYRLGSSKVKDVGIPKGFTPVNAGLRGLGFVASKFDSVFPVFYKHYDDHSFGFVAIHNFESVEASDIRATVEVKRYMDEPKSAVVAARLEPGRTIEIELFGLFTDKILEIVEATKLPVSVKLQYSQYGKTYTEEYVATLSVLDRNAITWDDDRKAAAFISAKDPSVLAFSKSVAASTRDLRSPGVNENLQATMAAHEALRVQRLTYVKDPASALETSSKQVVDFIQFPQQTLSFGSGKCGDLTALYCSMLEAVGVSTALITVPGHILMAVDLEMPPDQATRTFLNPGDLIARDGTVWLPIETTMRTERFVQAWQEGARQWRAGQEKGTAAFYPVHEAWRAYQPVAFSGAATITGQKDPAAGARSFQAELAAFISSETGPRVAALQAQIKKAGSGASGLLYNSLGVLFARYGQYDKAADQFKAALKAANSGGATFNMGNILFLQGRYAEALGYYSQAKAAAPYDPKIVLAGARANAALGNYDVALQDYSVLKSLNPELAAKYAYLGGGEGGGTRAADAAKNNGDLLWQD